MTETAIIDLSFTRPPLNLNQRMHWAQKAKLTKEIRDETALKARQYRNRFHGHHFEVELHWRPRDNRRRDEENPIPTLKAICDGLVDAGLADDDTPADMRKHMPIIHPAIKGEPAECWIEIRATNTGEIAA